MASKVITIEINNDYIKVCEVMYAAQDVNVYSAVTVATPDGCVEDGQIRNIEALTETLKKVIEENGIKSKNVIFTLQSTRVASKEVITPVMKPARIMEFITTNATEYFPVNIEEYVFSYSLLDTFVDDKVKKNRIMVVAAPIGMVEGYYSLAENLNLNVVAVDYAGNSIIELIKLQVDKAPSIAIQMGEDNTIVSIIVDGTLSLMRTVPYGKSTVASALVDNRNISYDEAVELVETTQVIKSKFSENDEVTDSLRYLANNISRIMDYYTTKNPNNPIEKAYIIPEGKAVVGIEELFADELMIPVSKIEEFKNVVATEELKVPLFDLTGYVANIGAVINPVNFIPPSALAKNKNASTDKGFRVMLIAAVGISIIIILIPFLKMISLKSDLKDINNKISNIEHIQDIVDEYYNAKDRYLDAATFKVLASNNDDYLLDFIEFLEHDMPSDISISSLSVADGNVTMSCAGNSKESLAAFIVTLKECESITDVYISSFSESMDSDGVVTVSYTLTCSFGSFDSETEAESEASTENTTEEAE